MADFTVDGLITSARDFATLSATAESGETTRLLRMLNREQTNYLTALLQGVKGGRQQDTQDYTTNGSTTRFAIPARAIAAGLKMLEGVDAAGNRWMEYLFPDERYANGYPANGTFYFEGNELVFYVAPPTGTLRVSYARRLSALVLTASARAITAINTGTRTVTIAAAPSTFTGRTTMDLVKGTPHFDTYGMDLACTAIGSGGVSVIFTNALPTGLAVGDYVSVPDESPVCQAPLELHGVLALRLAYVWCKAKKDAAAARELEGLLAEAKRDALKLLEPRLEEDALLVNPNAPGWYSRRGYGGSGVAP